MSDIRMEDYSRALDEIYALRTLLAYEAGVVEAHLAYKSFPKLRRQFAEKQVERLRRAACGEGLTVVEELPYSSRRWARTAAGMRDLLTRASWEAERST